MEWAVITRVDSAQLWPLLAKRRREASIRPSPRIGIEVEIAGDS